MIHRSRDEHAIERCRELQYNGPFDLHSQVAPAAHHPVAGILIADIETADDGAAVVGNHQLAMIAESDAKNARRIEEAQLCTSIDQLGEKILRQLAGTKVVKQNSNTDAPTKRREERSADAFAGRIPFIDIHLETNRSLGAGDQRLDGGDRRRAIGQQLEKMIRGDDLIENFISLS